MAGFREGLSIFSSKNEPGEQIYFSYKMSLEAVAKRPAAVFRSCAPPLPEADEQFLLGCLHRHRCRSVGLRSCFSLQVLNRHVGFEMPRQPGYLPQDVPWRCIPPVHALLL